MNFLVVDAGIRIFGAMVFACHSIQSRGVDFVLILTVYFNDLARYKVAFMTQQPHQFKEHFVSFQMYTLMYNRIIYCSNIIYKNIFGFTIIVPGVIVFSSVLKKGSITIYCYCGSFKTNFSKSVIIQQCKKQLHSQISNNFFYWQRHCCF